MGCAVAVALVVLVGGWARAQAQVAVAPSEKVGLTAEKAVYNSNASDAVKFTLKNAGSTTVFLSTPSPWSVFSGTKLVFAPISLQVIAKLDPGQSKTWSWDRKDMNGKKVGPGTYTVKVGTIWSGSSSFSKSVSVALTPTGKLAGSSSFPLAVGNQWVYTSGPLIGVPGGFSETSKVTSKSGNWYKVTSLVGADRWAHLNAAVQPTLYVVSKLYPPTISSPLFRFNRALGYSYKVEIDSLLFHKLKVGAKNETVVTPAGTFTGCYRLDALENVGADIGYGSFWFAKGVGLVQYGKIKFWGEDLYQLTSAKIKGSDGKVYTIGQK